MHTNPRRILWTPALENGCRRLGRLIGRSQVQYLPLKMYSGVKYNNINNTQVPEKGTLKKFNCCII